MYQEKIRVSSGTLIVNRSAPMTLIVIWIVVFSLLTVLGAMIRIPLPFTPVPITLQTLFALLAGAMLGPSRGAISLLLYLCYGIFGLPVFAGGLGIAAILGPTGGYLIAFPIGAFLTGLLVQDGGRLFYNLFAFILGSLSILILGSVQLSIFTKGSLLDALVLGFAPFLSGAVIKSSAASLVYYSGSKILSAKED